MNESTAPTFEIRPATLEDNAAIAAIIRTVMPEFGADGPGFAIHDAEVDCMFETYARPRSAFFVIERNGHVLGGAGIAPLENGDPDICELRKMYFLRDLRGLGAGKAVIERCLDAAREFGFRACIWKPSTAWVRRKRCMRAWAFAASKNRSATPATSAAIVTTGSICSRLTELRLALPESSRYPMLR